MHTFPVNSKEEALDEPAGDLPVGVEKDRNLEVDDDGKIGFRGLHSGEH